MADVEMKDATPAEGKAKVPAKASKGGAAETGDNKKRFEVKKVIYISPMVLNCLTKTSIVECCCSVGLGYRCGQLRYLPESHHGSV
jgi:hypothetical protein